MGGGAGKTLIYTSTSPRGETYTIPFFLFTRKLRQALIRSISGATALLGGVIIYGTFSEYLLEHNVPGSGVKTLFDSLWFVVQTITTVGYGDTPVVTFWGRVNAIVLMLVGIGTLGLYTASVASILIERGSRRRLGWHAIRLSGHTILCNWSPTADRLVAELMAAKRRLVILAPLEKPPSPDPEFVSGTSLHAADLQRAKVQQAESVIILPGLDSPDEPPSGVDAKTILGVMNVKGLNRSARIVVELLKEDSVENARSAGADEVVVRGVVTAKLLSRAALDPGTIDIIQTMLTGNSGEELFEDPIPASAEGKPYGELAKRFTDDGATSIAVRTQEGLKVNPSPSTVLGKGSVVYLARKRVKPQ